MSKKIGMLLDGEFPPDLRVENEMRSLAEIDYEIHLLCYDFSGQKPENEMFQNGITIHRIKVSRQFHNKLNALALTIPIYFWFWKKRAKNFIDKFKIDVVHVHDLRLAQVGYWLKRQIRIPYILDLHENYPAALRYYAFANSLPGRFLISLKQWERYEYEQVRKADAIVTVIEEMSQRIESLGVSSEQIFTIPNYININTFDDQKIAVNMNKKDDEVLLFYSGGFDRHRGLETVIKAMSLVQSQNQNVKLHLVGSGRTEQALKDLKMRLKLKNVIFHGWQPERAIPSFIEACDIGIVPHLKNEHTDFTIPHKLFQYLYKKKPVIVSNCNPLKRLVNEMQAGLVFENANEKDFSEKVLTLVDDPKQRNQLAKNGYHSIIQKYHWQTCGDELARLYHHILDLKDVR